MSKKTDKGLSAAGVLLGLGTAVLSGARARRRKYRTEDVRALLARRFPGEAVSCRRRGKDLWIGWFDDLPEAVFPIRKAVSGGDPVPAYRSYLACGDRDALWRYYMELYRKEWGSLDAWTITRLRTGETYLTCSYAALEEVRRAAEQLEAFYRWGAERPHWDRVARPDAPCVFCTFRGGPLPPVNTGYTQNLYPGQSVKDMLERCGELVREYYACYLLPCPDFSREELLAYARERWDWEKLRFRPERVRRGEEELPLELFSGVPLYGMGRIADEVNIGHLYVLAQRLGFAPEGAPEHFSFRGADGSRYEFSYDFFRDADITRFHRGASVRRVWYYLRDGRPVEPELWRYAGRGRDMPVAELSGSAGEAMLGIRFIFARE